MTHASGIHDIPAAQYHADPCEAPSLSASIAAILLEQSPRHAWEAHPRLNPRHEPEHRKEFDIGTAAHALILGGGAEFSIVGADDWRTKAAQQAREDARAKGLTPVLAWQFDQLKAMADVVRAQIDASEDAVGAFVGGAPERTLIWSEGDVWCRARPDWLPATKARTTINWDLKTTTNAEPGGWIRSKITAMGYDVQGAFYLRGLRALGWPETLRFGFVVAETEPPFGVSIVGISPTMMAMADEKVQDAIDIWRRCTATNQWPAYTGKTCWADPQPWDQSRWLERRAREDRPAPAALEAAMNWQRPIA